VQSCYEKSVLKQDLYPHNRLRAVLAEGDDVMIAETLFIALCIFAVAFMFAPIGMGGGMLFVPLIHYGLGWEINGALFAVSLTLTAVVSWGSGLAHRKEDYFDNSALKMGLRGAVPGALVGVGIVTLIDDKMDFVFKVLSVMMITWAIYKTVRKMEAESKTEDDSEQPTEPQTIALQIGAGIGGMLSSVLAIGAGVIYVPILRTFGQLEPRKAIGTSLHFMMVVVPVAIFAHLIALPSDMFSKLGEEFLLILIFMVLTFLGARNGARYGMKYLSEKQLMQIFLMILIVVVIRYTADLIGF